MTRHLLAPVLALLLTGCVSSIRIVTEPPGAKVRVDGRYLGRAPVVYSDAAPVGTTHTLDVDLEGYEPTSLVFSRNGMIQPAAVCAGAVCLVPFAWALDYPRRIAVELFPETAAPSPGRGAGPARRAPASRDPLDRPPYPGWEDPAPLSAPPPPPPEADRASPGDEAPPDRAPDAASDGAPVPAPL